ncbi:transport and Golgi organization protein 1 homolog [Hyperolius riggenbachi]|uniref:transport and Golgi organization protein 1 homolog n=1 Tax=Hyperolius riggenbachi TaxID=752182 RepID=UPI0035A35345
MAAAGLHLLLLFLHVAAGSSSAAQRRTLAEYKRCADAECSTLMYRGKATQDFTGPDCRFVNFKKDESVYVYHKLSGRCDLWAGTVGTFFGYFPKHLIDIQQKYVEEELEVQFPTDETDFVCFEDGQDTFDSYNCEELLSKSITGRQRPSETVSPSESESSPTEKSASEPKVTSEGTSPSESEETPGEKNGNPTMEASSPEIRKSPKEPAPSETKEPPEKTLSSEDSDPVEKLLPSKQEEQPPSDSSTTQDRPSSLDLTPAEPSSTESTLSSSGSQVPSEEKPVADSGNKKDDPAEPDSLKSGQSDSVKPSIDVSEEKKDESNQIKDENKISEDTLSSKDVHTPSVNSHPKDSQEESVLRQAVKEHESQVPQSEEAKNGSLTQVETNISKDKDKDIDSYTLLDNDRITRLKTEIGSTGDAVVSDDEETKQVTVKAKFLVEEEGIVDEPFEPQEENDFDESSEPPLLSYEESDMNVLDQSAFDNDSASSPPSETKASPPEEEVSVDMGHASPVKQENNILTTLGDTFFAIVSGGDITKDVTDLDRTDSEEQEEEEEDFVEQSKDDENLYLLGMEEGHKPHNQHLDDLFFPEDPLKETTSAAEGDKSGENEPKSNSTTTSLSENKANTSSTEEMPRIINTEEVSKSEPEPVDPEDDVKERQIPKDDRATTEGLIKTLEGSDIKPTETNPSGEIEGKATGNEKPKLEDLKENKEIKSEFDKDQESIKREDSVNENVPKDSKLEMNQEESEDVRLDKGEIESLPEEVPEEIKSVTSELPKEAENTQQSSDTDNKEITPPESDTSRDSGDEADDGKPVDNEELQKLPTVKDVLLQNGNAVNETLEENYTNQKTDQELVISSENKDKQDSKDDIEDSLKGASLTSQDLEGTTASDIKESTSVDKVEIEDENVDNLLEDENAASARLSRELAESQPESEILEEADLNIAENEEKEPEQELKNSELESKNDKIEEPEDSSQVNIEYKKDDATEAKEEDPKEEKDEETVDDAESLNEKKSNPDGSDSKEEEQEAENEKATLEIDDKAETTEEDVREDIPDQSNDKIGDKEDGETLAEGLGEEDLPLLDETSDEESYVDTIKSLSIIREYLDEERITQFKEYLSPDNVLRLEAMFQDMDSELKLARRDNVRLDYIDKALDQILEASESNILEFVESVLDSRNVNNEELLAGDKDIYEIEAALLDDIQEISYKLREKHSTLTDSSQLARGEGEEEDKPFAEGINTEEEKTEAEEESITTQPAEEDTVEQPADTQEVGPESVTPTRNPLDPATPKPDEANSQEVGETTPSQKEEDANIVIQEEKEDVTLSRTQGDGSEDSQEEDDSSIVSQKEEEVVTTTASQIEDDANEMAQKENSNTVLEEDAVIAGQNEDSASSASKDEEDSHTVPVLEEEAEETSDSSQSRQISAPRIFSGVAAALIAAKKSLAPVASLVLMDDMEPDDPLSSSSAPSLGVGADAAVLGTLPTLYSLLASRLIQLMSALPEDLQPGPDFHGVQWEAVIITLLVGILSIMIFFWRTCLSVKSRLYQVSEKQLAEKIAALVKEKSDALEKISELETKIKEAKESEGTTQEKSTHLQEEAAALKVTLKEMKNSNKQFDARMRSLLQELETQKEQNKRKQEMIYDGQKSIEHLQKQFEQHSAELSELQVVLNEAKMKEQKVRLDLHRVQEENSNLKERKEQLLQEADGWSERQRELEEHIRLQQKSHKDMEEALAYKENEIEVLTNCIMQLKQLEEDSVAGEESSWQPPEGGELENGEVPDKHKEKMRLQIRQMMDVSRVKTTLSIIEEEKDLYQRKLMDEVSSRHELEEQIKQLQHDSSSIHSDKTRLDNECKTLRQKVEILTELYQQKEMALQKKLTQEEYERQEKEQKLTVADEKAILAVEEVKIYKQRIQEMEEELQKTERSFKNQIAGHEKKAHENWLTARTAERTLAEEKRECANLRQKLIEVNQRIAALQRPSIVKPTPGRPEHQPPPRRGNLSRDGSFGPSPVSGGAPSPPIMMDGSVRSASANLSRSEESRGNLVDLGHSAAVLNSGPRTSSPSVDGMPSPAAEFEAAGTADSSPQQEESPAVMPIGKGPLSFPGTPVMNSPAGPPVMSQPPGRMIGGAPPRGHFSARSLPPGPMHGPPPAGRDFPPRHMMPPGGMPPLDPRGLIRGPLPPREYPPGSVPLHGLRDYPGAPPGARDFPPGLPPPGHRDFPPGPPHPGARDFPPSPLPPLHRDFPPGGRDFHPGPPPGARDFPPGLPPPGVREFPPGLMPPGARDFPPGPLPPGARDIPPGLPPPGARDFPPMLPPPGAREFVPGLPPPGARDFLPGPPPGSREFLSGPPLPNARDYPPGVRDFSQGPHPGVPAGPSLHEQRHGPPGHRPPSQTDHEQSQGQNKP